MDMDISDILADVSRPLHSTSTPRPLDSTTSLSDHQLLLRAWTSERTSPSLLAYPTGLLDRTTSRIRTQIARIEDLSAGASDPYGGPSGATTTLVLSILQTDLGRTQFVVRSYLRQRLAKLTEHPLYYLRAHEASETKDSPLLSPAEVAFVVNHQALLSRFYDDAFLGAFPASLRRLDDRAGGVDMVEGPDWGGAVVVRCLREEWANAGEVEGASVEGEAPGTELRMGRGEVWVVRWRDVRGGVVRGDLELL